MNPTRKTKAEDLAVLERTRIRQQELSPDAQLRAKLFELQAFIRQLEKTTQGKADLDRRARELGVCIQNAGETDYAFYGRLRIWLDKDLRAER